MSHCICDQFEVGREQPLQKKPASVSALLVAVHFLWWIQSGKNCQDFFFKFHSQNSYISKEYSFTKYNKILHECTYIFLRNAYGPLMQTVRSFHGILLLWMDQLQV